MCSGIFPKNFPEIPAPIIQRDGKILVIIGYSHKLHYASRIIENFLANSHKILRIFREFPVKVVKLRNPSGIIPGIINPKKPRYFSKRISGLMGLRLPVMIV